jgi:hypothetical protein
MKNIFLMTLLLISSCREFYDEEFLKDQEQRNEEGRDDESGNESTQIFRAELLSTDAQLTSLQGTAHVDIADSKVSVDFNLDGIPRNIHQLTYTYLLTNCQGLATSLEADVSSSRSIKISETLTIDSLAQDLSTSGASTSNGDTTLEGKYFVVKAFSNFARAPSPDGTNQFFIACGQLVPDTETETEPVNAGTIGGTIPPGGTTF